MKYIKYTYVDAKTEICITKEPAKNGPKHPNINGLRFVFAAERKYPTDVPEFFGTCDDAADLSIGGCFGEISESEFIAERQEEINARKPFASWVVNQEVYDNSLMLLIDPWSPPVFYPNDGRMYSWDEATTSWKETESTPA
jgi:hypothetical protein